MTETQLITQLRENIKEALATVTLANSPTIYKLIQTESGYRNIEEMIIAKMIQNNFSASACIPHLEREL
ncbi:hypothetical protein DNC80_15515 [Flavobacterium sp. SOK18b]|uniref:hypothetical protein n=1 Tax=Flavobacterium sp. SOK18b TaxID=797900 RepID=UPI0015FA6FC8|nr:hypothetical protein [Flavobacterium sp. SOK18b]MBB1195073.1 hypothetical protein [Flavobacterium sp. SOK18b]